VDTRQSQHPMLTTAQAIVAFAICLLILIGAVVVASLVQRDFGRVEVTNVVFSNYNGIPVRAKLLKPAGATQSDPMPGVVPISTWFYQQTGKIYLGAFLNAMLVAWMFTSSQVIAPIPI
jgi:hypothetical protein